MDIGINNSPATRNIVFGGNATETSEKKAAITGVELPRKTFKKAITRPKISLGVNLTRRAIIVIFISGKIKPRHRTAAVSITAEPLRPRMNNTGG